MRNYFPFETNFGRFTCLIFVAYTVEKEMRAYFNHRRSMKAETNRHIPLKLVARLKFVLLFITEVTT